MSQRLHYARAVNGPALLEQLQAAIPALVPVVGPDDERHAVMMLEASTTEVWITVPDAVTSAAVDAVVAAHNPAVPSAGEAQAAVDTTALTDFIAAYPAMLARLATIQGEMDAIQGRADNLAGLSTWSGLTLAQTTARLQAVMPQLGQDLSTVASEFKAVAIGLENMLQALAVLKRRQGA